MKKIVYKKFSLPRGEPSLRVISPVLATVAWSHNATYILSEAWSGVNRADLMAAQGAFVTDFYDKGLYSVQSIVTTIVLVDQS